MDNNVIHINLGSNDGVRNQVNEDQNNANDGNNINLDEWKLNDCIK